jgi:hypothetical protein
MPIYKEFKQRIDRTLDRAIETAKGSTLNRAAWNEVVTELGAMKRLLDEGASFMGDSLRRAEVAWQNSDTLETLAIQQAEDSASAKLIGDNTGIFEINDVGTVLAWLEQVRPDVFSKAWDRLQEERRMVLMFERDPETVKVIMMAVDLPILEQVAQELPARRRLELIKALDPTGVKL